ncbi:MAG: acetyl-CoA carboxylase biotin carboxyl carrier protein subunit [Oscillospiraceae bacterium]|nr:acetyl-CoA carboxylase biotin carboxyl carrier protein subunit [Oscillospiraceae bacterium]
MKSYNITVNGKTFQVQVEENRGGPVVRTVAPAPVAAPTPVAAPAPVAAPVAAPTPAAAPVAPAAAPVAGGGAKVEAPMPGKILSINVAVGDAVTQNQALCILEAMKMENEIAAPVAGTITSVCVTKGETVDTAKVLFTIG